MKWPRAMWTVACLIGLGLAIALTLASFKFTYLLLVPSVVVPKAMATPAECPILRTKNVSANMAIKDLSIHGDVRSQIDLKQTSPNIVPAVVGTASPAAGADVVARKDGDNKDAISNVMTAVATAITAITLILAVGTSWFAVNLRELRKYEQRIEKKEEQLDKLLGSHRRDRDEESELKSKLLATHEALRDWLVDRNDAAHGWTQYDKISVDLESLQAPDENIRRRAFGFLLAYLSSLTKEDALYIALESYTDACHEYHRRRMNEAGPGIETRSGQVLWCRIFSANEQRAFAESQLADGRTELY